MLYPCHPEIRGSADWLRLAALPNIQTNLVRRYFGLAVGLVGMTLVVMPQTSDIGVSALRADVRDGARRRMRLSLRRCGKALSK
jgi:hypothetical protein